MDLKEIVDLKFVEIWKKEYSDLDLPLEDQEEMKKQIIEKYKNKKEVTEKEIEDTIVLMLDIRKSNLSNNFEDIDKEEESDFYELTPEDEEFIEESIKIYEKQLKEEEEKNRYRERAKGECGIERSELLGFFK